MQQKLPRPLSIFCVAAPQDSSWLIEWEKHLGPLQQTGYLKVWSEHHVQVGQNRAQQITGYLNQADLIVFLLSSDFFASQECYELMERVLHRQSQARVLLLLVRPVSWRESPLATFSYLPSNGRPVTQWDDPEAAFDDCVRQIRRLLGRPITAPLPSHHGHLSIQQQNRIRMLQRLRQTYHDVLNQSLQGVTQIELGLATKPDVVQNAINLLFRSSTSVERSLPPGTSLLRVYDEANQDLLILGAPGAGKSTLLVELALQLVARAGQDNAHPLPVILPLSSWATKQPPFEVWLSEQIAQIYDIPRTLARRWIDEDQILPLLDGLDEVEESGRSSCIAAINTYHSSHLVPLVVCSRHIEYMDASKQQRLKLYSAVVVQPLTSKQVSAYLATLGAPLAGLRHALSTNIALRETATSPLMLHVLTLTYYDTSMRQLPTQQNQLQRQVWTDYLERMVARKGNAARYPLEQTRQWLGWLAYHLRTHNQTTLYLEHLHSGWLSAKQQGTYTRIGVRWLAIVISILICILVRVSLYGFLREWLWHLLLDGVLGGWIGWLWSESTGGTPSVQRKHSAGHVWGKRLSTSFLFSLIVGICFSFDVVYFFGTSYPDYAPLQPLPSGLLAGFLFGFGGLFLQACFSKSPRSRVLTSMAKTSHRLHLGHLFQTRIARRALLIAGIFGLIFGLIWGISMGLSNGLNEGLFWGLSSWMSRMLSYGLISLLIGLVLEEYIPTIHLADRIAWSWSSLVKSLFRPRHLLRSALVASCIMALVGLSVGLSDGVSFGLLQGPVEGLNRGLSGLWRYGLSYGLVWGLGYWSLFGLFQGITPKQIEDRDRRKPNQGIHNSWRNAVIMGIIGEAMIGVIGFLALGLSKGFTAGQSVGLNAGLTTVPFFIIIGACLVFLLSGGIAVLRHFLIRFLLARSQTFPWQAISFLDDATARIFLRRVNGGYSFIHRLLLDHLADTASFSTIAPDDDLK